MPSGIHFSLRLGTVFVLLGLCTSRGLGNEGEIEAAVKRAVGQLDSPLRMARLNAIAALAKLGPAALPFLPAPDALENPSARAALRSLRARLEEQKAKASLAASTISLKKTAPLAEILKAITRQTENEFDVSSLPVAVLKSNYAAEWNSVSFWQAIRDLSQELKFDVREGLRPHRLKLVPAKGELGKTTTFGPVRARVLSVIEKPLGDSVLMNVRLELLAEPRLRPLFLTYHGKELSGKTKSGRTLQPLSPGAKPELPVGQGGGRVVVQLSLVRSKNAKPEPTSLLVTLRFLIAAGHEEFVFSRLEDKNVAKRRGGVTVTLRKAVSTANRATVSATVAYDSGGRAFESHRTWIFHNAAYLERAGKRIAFNDGVDTHGQADGAVAVSYKFKELPASAKHDRFIYVAPTLITKLDLPIRISLPYEKEKDSR